MKSGQVLVDDVTDPDNATIKIKHNSPITVSCADGEIGKVYRDILPFKINRVKIKELPQKLQKQIYKKISPYKNPKEFYIEKLRESISTITAAFYPKPIIVRFSDFKSNKYANLLGGKLFEPQKENFMIEFRGSSRYLAKQFTDCFSLECEAIKRVLNMGLSILKLCYLLYVQLKKQIK